MPQKIQISRVVSLGKFCCIALQQVVWVVSCPVNFHGPSTTGHCNAPETPQPLETWEGRRTCRDFMHHGFSPGKFFYLHLLDCPVLRYSQAELADLLSLPLPPPREGAQTNNNNCLAGLHRWCDPGGGLAREALQQTVCVCREYTSQLMNNGGTAMCHV